MNLFKVGEFYLKTKTEWQEGVEYIYRDNTHELRMFLRNPTNSEILAIKSGVSKFALVVERDAIFFLYAFEPEIAWSESSYSIHTVPKDHRTVPPLDLSDSQKVLLNITLVDADTGIIKVLRAVSLDYDFTMALHKAINEQAEKPFDQNTYGRDVMTILNQSPTQVLLRRAIVRCTCGS